MIWLACRLQYQIQVKRSCLMLLIFIQKPCNTNIFFFTDPLLFFKVQREFYFNIQRAFKNIFHTFSTSSFFRRWSAKHKIVVILTTALRSQIHLNSYCRGEQASSYSVTTALIRGGEQNVFMSVFDCVPYIWQWLVAGYEKSLLGCP